MRIKRLQLQSSMQRRVRQDHENSTKFSASTFPLCDNTYCCFLYYFENALCRGFRQYSMYLINVSKEELQLLR